jgi:hypothetical protein
LAGALDRKTIPSPALLDELVAAGCLTIAPPDASPRLAARRMASAHSLLLIDWAERDAGSQVPSKLYVYARIGRPVLAITRRGSPVDRILSGAGTPHVALYPEDANETVDAKVRAFLELPTDPRQPSEWFLEQFDGRRQAGMVARILRGDLTP